MLLDHDDVDRLGVAEGEEAEAAGPARSAIAHHGALHHLAELREVVAEGF